MSMSKPQQFLGLDVGTVRIGVAVADSSVWVAVPHSTIIVDGHETEEILRMALIQEISTIVVGYPRNQSGDATAQTRMVEVFVESLKDLDASIVYQDESLTSVMAEQRLKARNRPYDKADIDSEAAAIILQDYLEQHR